MGKRRQLVSAAATGCALIALILGELSGPSQRAAVAAASTPGPQSVVPCTPPHSPNTILCNKTRQADEDECALMVRPTTASLTIHSHYGREAHERSWVRFRASTPGGCSPAGREVVRVRDEVRNGPGVSFIPYGQAIVMTVVNLKSRPGAPRLMTVTAPTPDCKALIAGSAVRPVVSVTWIPKKGWSNKGPQTFSITGQTKAVC